MTLPERSAPRLRGQTVLCGHLRHGGQRRPAPCSAKGVYLPTTILDSDSVIRA
jgi:hypothetical protein